MRLNLTADVGGGGIGAPFGDDGTDVFRQLAFEKHLFTRSGVGESDGFSV